MEAMQCHQCGEIINGPQKIDYAGENYQTMLYFCSLYCKAIYWGTLDPVYEEDL